jgi:ribosomal protein S18 acetylase RimI-like enzyme
MNAVSIVEANLRTAMRFFGMATANAAMQEMDRTVAMYCGLDYGVFNLALLTRPAVSDADLKSAIEEAGRYFQSKAVRWSFWLCEDLLDARTRRHARQIFAEYGQRPILHPPGMLAERLAPPSRPLPTLEFRPVTDAAMRNAFAEITTVTFEIPPGIARAVYESELGWRGDYRGFVGLVESRPVAIAAIVEAAGAWGVYSVGTLPEFRRKGYGETLMRAALAACGGAGGPVILQSTQAGYDLYRRMGFRDVARFTVYLKS